MSREPARLFAMASARRKQFFDFHLRQCLCIGVSFQPPGQLGEFLLRRRVGHRSLGFEPCQDREHVEQLLHPAIMGTLASR